VVRLAVEIQGVYHAWAFASHFPGEMLWIIDMLSVCSIGCVVSGCFWDILFRKMGSIIVHDMSALQNITARVEGVVFDDGKDDVKSG